MKHFILRSILSALLVLFSTSSNAQSMLQDMDHNYKTLETWMESNKEKYDSLMTRFLNADTLSVSDAFTLYYGYTYTDKYEPMYSEDEAASELYSKGNNEAAYKAYLKEYDKNPLFMRTLLRLAMLTDKLGYAAESKKYAFRFVTLAKAIRWTGDASKEHPMHVICVPDEYMMVKMITDFEGYEMKKQSLVESCDVLELQMTADGSIRECWFNVSRYFAVMQKHIGM